MVKAKYKARRAADATPSPTAAAQIEVKWRRIFIYARSSLECATADQFAQLGHFVDSTD
jgi:hypothetical protein